LKILDRILGRTEKRELNHEDFFGRPLSGPSPVTHERALQDATVLAAVRALTHPLATCPLRLFERMPDGSRRKATEHPLYYLMHDAPNAIQTSVEFREQLFGWQELFGCAFAECSRNDVGDVVALWPIHPSRVSVAQEGATLNYTISTKSGQVVVGQDKILHFRAMTGANDARGLDTVATQRRAIGGSIAANEYSETYFANAATPGGVITHPALLNAEAVDRLRRQSDERTLGKNKHTTLILEEGAEFKPLTHDAEKSQLVSARTHNIQEVCRAFGVQPSVVFDTSRNTYSNSEQEQIAFLVHSIRPRAVRAEQRLNLSLIPERDRRKFYFQFDLAAMTRGDLLSQYRAAQLAIQTGWANRNEVREIFDMNRAEGLDEFVLAPGTGIANTEDKPDSGTGETE